LKRLAWIIPVLLIVGFIAPTFADEGVNALSAPERDAALEGINRSRGLLDHPVEIAMTRGVRVTSVVPDQGCRAAGSTSQGYRVHMDVLTLFGFILRRTTSCGTEVGLA
jgi:hypothetical protein